MPLPARSQVILGHHPVLALYMVVDSPNGANPAITDYEAQMLWSKAHGVTGWILDCGGWNDPGTTYYKTRCTEIYAAADTVGFGLCLCADYCCGLKVNTMVAMVQQFWHEPSQMFVGKKALLFAWGGQRLATPLRAAVGVLAAQGEPVAFLPDWLISPETLAGAKAFYVAHPWVSGSFQLNQGAMASTLAARIGIEGAAKPKGYLLAAGVSPYYNSSAPLNGGVYGGDFSYMLAQLQTAVVADPDMLIVSTENGCEEQTQIEPSQFFPPKNIWGKVLTDRSSYIDLGTTLIKQWEAEK